VLVHLFYGREKRIAEGTRDDLLHGDFYPEWTILPLYNIYSFLLRTICSELLNRFSIVLFLPD